MPSTISAGTTAGTAIAVAGDTTGNLAFQTNGTTTAMTIDTSQNVLIGDTTAAISNNNFIATQSLNTTAGIAVINNNTGNSASASVRYKNSGSTIAYTLLGGTNRTSYAGIGANILSMYTDNAAGMSFLVDAAGPITFNTNTTERMRIDSSGNVLVGNNSGSYTGSGSAGFINLSSTASTETQITWVKATQVECHAGFKTSTDSNFYINTGGALGTFGVYLTNTGTSWTSNSDERLKENLVPITDATNKVSQLRAVIGNYINDESKKARPFLIAQDVQAVFPEAVSVNTDELGTLGVSYTDVIPLLVASIKELKAELDATKAEVQALKGVK